LQRLAVRKRNVVLSALQTRDSDIHVAALYDRKLDIDTQAASRVQAAYIVPGQFTCETTVPQAATQNVQKARLFE
jgi:hypothetical protein